MIALMYHDIEDDTRPNEKRGTLPYHYVVSADTLRQHLDRVAALKLNVVSLTEYLKRLPAGDLDPARTLILTFDDGHESVERVAMPILREYGYAGTTQVIAGFVNEPDKHTLDAAAMRRLIDAGWDIGSHGLHHVVLPELDDAALRRELVESKERLEAAVGSPVEMMSIPHGPYDRRVRRAVIDAGYQAALCSAPGRNAPRQDRFAIRRMTITRAIDLSTFEKMISGDFRFYAKERTRRTVLFTMQKLLGSRRYEAIRAKLLRSDGSKQEQSP